MANGSESNPNGPPKPTPPPAAPEPALAKAQETEPAKTPSAYYTRSETPISSPVKWIFLTIGAPLAALILAYFLLQSINLHGPAGTDYPGLTHKVVRTTIQESLTRDLASERLQGLLLEIPDAPAPPPAKSGKPEDPAAAAARRKSERTERFKPAASRLAGDVARLTDMLTMQVLTPHPGIERQTRGATASKTPSKVWLKDVVEKRLGDKEVDKQVQEWATQALDPFSRQSAQRAMAKTESIEKTVASAVAAGRLRAVVTDAITPSIEPFEVRTGAAVWAADVSARLTWGIVALVFCLAWLLVVLSAVLQIMSIDAKERMKFVVWVVVASIAAAGFSFFLLPEIFSAPTPLHKALSEYAVLYGLGVIPWASVLTVLTAIGIVALLAGASATLWVTVTKKDELEEQLRGFKTLFNSGAILLFAGVLEVYALFRWPIVFIGDDVARTAMQSAAGSLAASVGALFSVLLLATYAPATTALRLQAIANNISPAEVSEAMRNSGFGDLASQQVLRLAQALLPLLPGVITVLASS